MASSLMLTIWRCAALVYCIDAHPCESEVSSACPDRPGSELALCLKDKSEHEKETTISSECTDFIALNAACKEDISKFCDDNYFTDDTILCLTKWTAESDLSSKCGNVLKWAAPQAAEEDSRTDELGLSAKDYEEKKAWQAKRRAERTASVEQIREDQRNEAEMETLKREDPESYKQLLREKEEAKRSAQELKKRKRLQMAADEREARDAERARRIEEGLPVDDDEETNDKYKKARKRTTLGKKSTAPNYLPYALGGIFALWVIMTVLSFFNKDKKDEDKEE